ncbi:ABC transporter permease [Bradyrhizobium tropiciagri]|uniref:ABC transporter permease n=1 Tax=Bradyrhizobium tropiciagri TaxID=312253 RepID=UPI001BADE901|nr:ABC transporter permease [Bradyrhizobium tropiciagri]MBR0898883.1 ABC transporter permease [Bradyrhizobium tropiciagri]
MMNDVVEPAQPTVSFSGEFKFRARILILQFAVGIGLLATWQFVSGRFIDPFFISSPVQVWARLVSWAASGMLSIHLGYTLSATAIGFVVGAICGFAFGFALGRNELVAAVLNPFITALYCLPKIALAPLIIMWFGIGIESKIAMSGIVVFFLVFLNTYSGVREVNPIFLNSLRIMGGKEAQLLRYVVVPSAMSWVLAGLKVSVPYALIGTVVGELMSSNRGIGFLIAQASGMFDTPGVFAGLVLLASIGVIVNSGLNVFESYALRWKR